MWTEKPHDNDDKNKIGFLDDSVNRVESLLENGHVGNG
jgi:hypothetical protein